MNWEMTKRVFARHMGLFWLSVWVVLIIMIACLLVGL